MLNVATEGGNYLKIIRKDLIINKDIHYWT